jgi:hypothetical protein
MPAQNSWRIQPEEAIGCLRQSPNGDRGAVRRAESGSMVVRYRSHPLALAKRAMATRAGRRRIERELDPREAQLICVRLRNRATVQCATASSEKPLLVNDVFCWSRTCAQSSDQIAKEL